MNRPHALRIAGGVAALAIVGMVAWAVTLGNAGGGKAPTSTATPIPFPPWPSPTASDALVPVQLVARNGSQLTVTLPDSEKVTFDLHKVDVFDCRTDCWYDVKAALPAIASTDRLCLDTTPGSPRQFSKLWVNRVTACKLTAP